MVVYAPDGNPFSVDPDVWTALLRVFPFGTYKDYVAREIDAKLGVTRSGGSFTLTFEDQDYTFKSQLSDLQEVWVGVQKGPQETPWNGVNGRAWLLGGWIEKRYHEIKKDTKRDFKVEGFDYMTVLPFVLFGTPDDPKVFLDADVGAIADAVATVLLGWGFSKAPGGDFVTSTGTKMSKTYEQFNKVSVILRDLADRISPSIYDWYIDYNKKIFFHQRGKNDTGMTIDWNNFREGKLVWGDCKELITNVWATEGEKAMIPEQNDWCAYKRDWMVTSNTEYCTKRLYDIYDWYYGTVDPYTGNPIIKDLIWSNVSETAGICGEVYHTTLYQHNRIDYPISFPIAVDCRNYTRIFFDYRADPIGSTAEIELYMTDGSFIYKDFKSQLTAATWKKVELELPLWDTAGNIVNFKGWSSYWSNPGPIIKRFRFMSVSGMRYGSVSNLRVFRSCYEEAKLEPNPYSHRRYLVVVDKELDTAQEAKARAEYELNKNKQPKYYLNPTVDGDPRYFPGKKVSISLVSPFYGIAYVIDEIQHKIGEDLDYVSVLTLGTDVIRASAAVAEGGDKYALSKQMAEMQEMTRRLATKGLKYPGV